MEWKQDAMLPDQTVDSLDTVTQATDPVATHGTPTASLPTDETASVTEETAATSETSEEALFFPVYNGQEVPLKASDREEITALLQLGMKQRDFLPTYERLSFFAKEDGAPSVKAWVEQLVKEREEAYREEAVRLYGDEAGQRFYDAERRERERRYTVRDGEAAQRERAQDEVQAQTERLAEEWMALQEQYPQYRSFRDLPQEVVETALREQVSLLDAYNRLKLAEQERCAREQTGCRAAASRSTGSLRGEPPSAPTPLDAFLKGLHSRV